MNLDRLLRNHSFAAARCFPLEDHQGFIVATTIVRLAFAFDEGGRLSLAFRPVRARPVFDAGGLRFPSDLEVEKPGTDIGLVGSVDARGNTTCATATLSVGRLSKSIRLVGARVYVPGSSGEMSQPRPLVRMSLSYDRCFGGTDPDDDTWICPENPSGRGFAREPKSLSSLPCPELEPAVPGLCPAHACFAPLPASFSPRCELAGTFDDAWAAERAPLSPLDRDPRHASWASPGLYSEVPLGGEIPVEMLGIIGRQLRFTIPACTFEIVTSCDGAEQRRDAPLDGILIDIDDRVVELTYRSSIRMPRRWERLTDILVRGTTPPPAEVLDRVAGKGLVDVAP